MQVNLKTSADKNFEGLCPQCREHTAAGSSCCGQGAIVEGGLVTDEEALADIEEPTVCVELLVEVPYEKAKEVHRALFAAGLYPVLFRSVASGNWNVNLFVPVSSLESKRLSLSATDLAAALIGKSHT